MTTKFDRERKKLAWNVMDTGRKKDGASGLPITTIDEDKIFVLERQGGE